METNHPLNATQTWAIAPGRSEIPWLTGLLLISLAVHVAAVVSIGKGRTGPHRKVKAPTLVTMTIEPARPAPSTAVAQHATGALSRVAPKRAAARPAKATVGAPRSATAEPAAETPADFTGVTLTNDGPGAGWASATGNGAAMNGPIGTPGARITGRSHGGVSGAAGAGPRSDGPPILELADLSKPPRAPVLSDMLERNYPDGARQRGVSGKAVMRLRVMPDGHLRDLIVVAESESGFGEACKRTLRDSLWSPPLDREARPVSTFVSYTCTFEVH
jgi:Gram-negative bacterial TonB protein C-terminal